MGDYDTILVFLWYLIQHVIFSLSSEEVSFTRFMEHWSDFSVFPTFVKDRFIADWSDFLVFCILFPKLVKDLKFI